MISVNKCELFMTFFALQNSYQIVKQNIARGVRDLGANHSWSDHGKYSTKSWMGFNCKGSYSVHTDLDMWIRFRRVLRQITKQI